ncbi:MAG TPA: FAD-binding oxidoreductase [Flavipsychrobacter sp.]|nr:FAD-binding oxidoreductase [Flavipsychrobacter sp.]
MRKKIANWGNYPAIESEEVQFTSISELKNIVTSNATAIARGNGRCYGDASLSSNVTISTLKFDKVLDFDTKEGIFECQAGVMLDQILEIIVPEGWFLPVTPGTKFITVGGAVASDVHGKNHHIDGAFSKHVIELKIMLSTGEVVTCNKEQNTDLLEATCGGMGLTGVIISVRFQLKKIETAYIKQTKIKVTHLEELLDLFEANEHFTYSVAWIDCLKKGNGFGRSVLLMGEHALEEELTEKQMAKGPLKIPKRKSFSFPVNLPSWILNNFTVRLFNFLYYNKNLKKESNSIISYEQFFYPLDSILHWNRGYGKKGFVQYQFVVPLENKEGLISILNKINEKGWGSFLAVLKIFGKQTDLISFPIQGYTLALDFPVRKNLFEFLHELDQIVLQHGGRIYLSKDARMKSNIFWKGYSNSEEFVSVVKKYNPLTKFQSIQSTRLSIIS